MFDYKSESIAWSITAENAEYREEQLRQELLANSITMENINAVTPEMLDAGARADRAWSESDSGLARLYKAMLEAA